MPGIGDFPLGLAGSAKPIPRTANGSLPNGRYYVTKGGERLDQVALYAYGIQSGAVEALLIVNPRLSDQPFYLPSDLSIELPELTPAKPAQTVREVNLWG